ncbi:helix-turn-helix domain-containing protein [Dinoroseobacter sp. S124A]|uniref:helix-turn-helix domain-containing protein n=1 Tax=Dinoroseobacter sp. S124A TaxID=3415128 RepID=UPI003C7D8DB1
MTIAEVLKATSAHTGIPVQELTGPMRSKPVVRARQLAQLMARMHVKTPSGKPPSFPVIARAFGGRDHSTVQHGVTTALKLIDDDADFRRHAASLNSKLMADDSAGGHWGRV